MSLENQQVKLRADVWDEMSTVLDPDIGLALTELGLIYDLQIDENGKANITMTLTSMACPIGPQLMESIKEAALRVDGIKDAHVEMVWTPPWDPREMASEDAKAYLGIY